MTLGEIIKEYRTEHGLSMDAFSERSGISKAYISLLEKNKHPQTGKPIAPSIQCIKQAADGMGIDFNVLFSKIDGDVSLSDSPTIAKIPRADTSILTKNEKILLETYRKLPELSKKRLQKYVSALSDMHALEEPVLNAANSRTDIVIPEGIDTSDDDIMDDENF